MTKLPWITAYIAHLLPEMSLKIIDLMRQLEICKNDILRLHNPYIE